MTDDFPYYYAWKNNPKRATLYQRPCRIIARGRAQLRHDRVRERPAGSGVAECGEEAPASRQINYWL